MKFTKMNGAGNDFVVIEDLNEIYLNKERKISKNLCNRHFSVGADGVLFVRKSEIADIKMVIINADGSYASMCGNGIRCFAKYVYDNKIVNNNTVSIETGDGIKKAFLKLEGKKVEYVTINMGKHSFDVKDIPVRCEEKVIDKKVKINHKEYNITSMFMGVPHTVVFSKLNSISVKEGKLIEELDIFPEKTNVNFCEVLDKNNIRIKTWERGVGPTLACGTGSCASVIAANKLGFVENKVKVQVPGGELLIEITQEGVLMRGKVEINFVGEMYIK